LLQREVREATRGKIEERRKVRKSKKGKRGFDSGGNGGRRSLTRKLDGMKNQKKEAKGTKKKQNKNAKDEKKGQKKNSPKNRNGREVSRGLLEIAGNRSGWLQSLETSARNLAQDRQSRLKHQLPARG